jgi:hypothetical protein
LNGIHLPRHQKLKWQKELNEQTEHRLQREGIFWHDKRLDGLSDDDRLVAGPSGRWRFLGGIFDFFRSEVVI